MIRGFSILIPTHVSRLSSSFLARLKIDESHFLFPFLSAFFPSLHLSRHSLDRMIYELRHYFRQDLFYSFNLQMSWTTSLFLHFVFVFFCCSFIQVEVVWEPCFKRVEICMLSWHSHLQWMSTKFIGNNHGDYCHQSHMMVLDVCCELVPMVDIAVYSHIKP